MPHTLVAFHAHPDDESLLTAGTMAKAAAEGHRVVLVVATAGEVGEAADGYRDDTGDLGTTRRAELARSAELLGVARVEVLGFRDSGSGTGEVPPGCFAGVAVDEAAEQLAAILREEDADVLTVYDANGGYGHRDHVHVHAVGHRAGERAGTPIVLEATIDRDLMKVGVDLATSLGYEIPDTFQPETIDAWFTPSDELTHAIDVGAFLATKRASMEAHASQSTSSTDGPRSIGLFLELPDEYFGLAFGTEWYVDRRRPLATDEATRRDVFAGLDDARDPVV